MTVWLPHVIVVAAVTAACASTGAVPRPFPAPARNSGGSPRVVRSPGPVEGDVASATETTDAATAGNRGYDAYGLVGTALELRGTPYRSGGSDPKGFDCSGFTQYVFAQHGIGLPRGVREQFQAGESVAPRDLAPGDLVFFAMTGHPTLADPGASHVAIVVGGDEFVHAPSSTGVVRVEHLTAPYWTQRYLGARRMEK